MAQKGKLLAVGGIRTVAERVDHPILYYIPPSFNAGKALLAANLSQIAATLEKRYVLHIRDNYTIEYARLNPDTMAVPTMQIDDKVITDSFDLCKYLSENYPGPGDQEISSSGKTAEMWEFIEIVKAWDEYMFTYGTVMSQSMADMANNIRLANLRYYLNEVLTTKPEDEEFLTEKYVRKIAGIIVMKDAQRDGEQKTKDLEENRAQLFGVLALGNQRAAQNPDGFLFGDKLCTADAFFLPIFRVLIGAKMLEEVFEKNPALEGYWKRAIENPQVEAGLLADVTPKSLVKMAWSTRAPKTILAYKTGFLKAPTLPQEIENRIEKAIDEKWVAVRGSSSS